MKNLVQTFKNESNILAFPNPFVTVSVTIPKGSGEDENGRKIVKAGTVLPKNDASAVGILLHDADTTDNDVEVAVIIEGYVYKDKLPVEVNEQAKAKLSEIKYI